MSDHRLLKEIEVRCRELLQRMAAGEDPPPGPRLRLEGLLEAAVLCRLLDVESWQGRLDALHREIVGMPVSERAGADWRHSYPFPEMPLLMERAPVTPSSHD